MSGAFICAPVDPEVPVSLHILITEEEGSVPASVTKALREALSADGRAILLMPSFEEALSAQRFFADENMGLGISCLTPSAWVSQSWEVWGDGRHIIGEAPRRTLIHKVLNSSNDLATNPGTVELLCRLVSRALPWLKEMSSCAKLTAAESKLLDQADSYACELRAHNMLEECEADVLIAEILGAQTITLPKIALVGFNKLTRAQRELICGLAGQTAVIFSSQISVGSAAAQPLFTVKSLTKDAKTAGVEVYQAQEPSETKVTSLRTPELQRLRSSLFETHMTKPMAPTGAVRIVLPAGPLSEARSIVQEIEKTTSADDDVVIAVADVRRAWRELAPKFACCGKNVQVQARIPFKELESGRAFLEFINEASRLVELVDMWPPSEKVAEGTKVNLGDMSWWPPRELTDFLLSDMAHMPIDRAYRLDASWRANRLLTPAAVLADLMAEKKSSASVAQATRELLRGRIGSAAAKLLMPYAAGQKSLDAEDADAVDLSDLSLSAAETSAVLTQVMSTAKDLRDMGLVTDLREPGALDLCETANIFTDVLSHAVVSLRFRTHVGQGRPIRLMDQLTAAHLPASSADAVLICGLSSEETSIPRDIELADELLSRIGVEPNYDLLAPIRADFARLIAVPRTHLSLERVLKTSDGADAYSAVVLIELLACYGIEGGTSPSKLYQNVSVLFGKDASLSLSETDICKNISDSQSLSQKTRDDVPSAAGKIKASLRSFVVVTPEGMTKQDDPRPLLSASQIETYLECPYKWFSLRRLHLGDADAGFSGAEMGTFAHRVLEVVHTQLAEEGFDVHEEAGLARAHELLNLEFCDHLRHQYLLASASRSQPQALIPHTSQQLGRLNGLKNDLDSLLDYEAGLLSGFKPCLFEWGFGRKDDVVSYAGARLVGSIDRVDVDEHGLAAVIDYKHKGGLATDFTKEYDVFPKGGRDVKDAFVLPRRVQSLIYAQVMRRAHPELKIVGALYLCTRSSHEIAGAIDGECIERIFAQKSPTSQRLKKICVSRDDDFGLSSTTQPLCGMPALLDACEEAIATHIESMCAGDIEANPTAPDACKYCPVLNCEKRLIKK
jgi:hypothetical protein